MMSGIGFLAACVSAPAMVLGTFLASYRMAWALVGPRPTALRWTAVLVVGTWLATFGFHVLFPVSLFNTPVGVVGCVLAAVGSYFVDRTRSTGRMLAWDRRILRHLARRTVTSLGGLMVLFFAPFVVLRVLRCLILPPLGWDSIAYHGVRAAQFVQNAGFTFDEGPGTWSFYRNFFAGGELLTAWAMLPFHSDLFANLVGGVQWLGIGLAAWALARELGLRGAHAGLCCWAGLFVPTLQLEIPSGYVEPALNLPTMAAAAFAVGFVRRAVPALGVLALAASGLAVGVKLTGAAPVTIFSVWVVAVGLLSRNHRAPGLPRLLGHGCLLGAAPVVPWLWHTYRDTGYPLSPVPLEILGLKLGVAGPHMQWFQMRDLSAAFTWSGEWEVLREIFSLPGDRNEGLGLLTALPLLLVPMGLMLGPRRQRGVLTMLFLALLSVVVMFYLPLFSVLRLYWSANCSRFLLTAVLFALPISMLWCRRFPRAGAAYAAALFGSSAYYAISLARFGWAPFESGLLAGSFAAVVAIAGVTLLCRRYAQPLALPVLAVLLVGATIQLDAKVLENRHRAVHRSVQLHFVPRYWVNGARALDDPERPRRIAITGGPNHGPASWLAYFYMGSRFQNRLEYVPISRDSEIIHYSPVDRRWSLGDRDAWLRRIEEEGITDVVSFIPPSVEQAWMESMPGRFVKVAGDRRWGVFRVVR